jgi:hypothetical protein
MSMMVGGVKEWAINRSDARIAIIRDALIVKVDSYIKIIKISSGRLLRILEELTNDVDAQGYDLENLWIRIPFSNDQEFYFQLTTDQGQQVAVINREPFLTNLQVFVRK